MEGFSDSQYLQLREIIELGDENASFVAQELRNDIAADLGAFLTKGLRLRSIDRKATTAAQDRAILEMEPTVISVQEGEIILRRGDRVTATDLEKYQEFLDLALEDSVLLPKRIFVTIVTLLFGLVYVSLVLPRFWTDGPRSGIVAMSIIVQPGIIPFYYGIRRETELFGANPISYWFASLFTSNCICSYDRNDHRWASHGHLDRYHDMRFSCGYAGDWDRNACGIIVHRTGGGLFLSRGQAAG